MSEHEINSFLRAVLQELDRTARQVIRHGVRTVVLPSALGAGLALCGGCDDRTAVTDGGPPGDVTVQDIMRDSGIDTLPPDSALADLAIPDAQPDGPVIYPIMPPQPDAGKVDGPVIYPILPPQPDAGKADGPVIYPILPPQPDAGKKADGPVIYPIMPPQPDGGKKPDGPVIYPIMPPPPPDAGKKPDGPVIYPIMPPPP